MEKVETPRHPGSAASTTESRAGAAVSGRRMDPHGEGLQIEAQATRWWAAYGGDGVSER